MSIQSLLNKFKKCSKNPSESHPETTPIKQNIKHYPKIFRERPGLVNSGFMVIIGAMWVITGVFANYHFLISCTLLFISSIVFAVFYFHIRHKKKVSLCDLVGIIFTISLIVAAIVIFCIQCYKSIQPPANQDALKNQNNFDTEKNLCWNRGRGLI